MNGTLSGFLISGLFSFKVSFLGLDVALEIWLFTKLFQLYPGFVRKRSSLLGTWHTMYISCQNPDESTEKLTKLKLTHYAKKHKSFFDHDCLAS